MSEPLRQAAALANEAKRRELNETAVRQIAQQDPVPNLTARFGEVAAKARKEVQILRVALVELDDLRDTLKEHGITVSADLTPIGNAAAAARRDLERERPKTFEMPRSDRA